MNTYDFDQTIYINDSSADFFFYCLKKYPQAVLKILPNLAVCGVKYALKKCAFPELKEAVFSYLKYIPDVAGANGTSANVRKMISSSPLRPSL